MHKKIYLWTSILGLLAVLMGAFGTHYFADKITVKELGSFNMAVSFHFYHVFALFICGILYKSYKSTTITIAAVSFMFGILFFCFSIYGLSAVHVMQRGALHWLTGIPPIGGVFFIIGWICLAIYFIKNQSHRPVKPSRREED